MHFDPDVNLALDTSSSTYGASSSQPARLSPVYAQQRGLNALEPTQASYHANPFPGLDAMHTPENSPNPGLAVANHSTSHPYLPTGPMQFSPPLPLPPRPSEIQSRYFAPYPPRAVQESLKRVRPGDDNDDSQADQADLQEQEAGRPKQSVDFI